MCERDTIAPEGRTNLHAQKQGDLYIKNKKLGNTDWYNNRNNLMGDDHTGGWRTYFKFQTLMNIEQAQDIIDSNKEMFNEYQGRRLTTAEMERIGKDGLGIR